MARETPVTQVMTADVITVRPEMTIEDAVTAFAQRGISGAPVIDEEGRLVGLLDDTDLLVSEARLHSPTTVEILGAYFPLPGERHRFADEVRHALGRTVGEVMETDPPLVRDDGTVEDVATLILDRNVSRVPVVDGDGRVVGIVTRGDLVKALGRSAVSPEETAR